MRQKQTLAFLSLDLHRKSVVPVVQNVQSLTHNRGQFQTFQSLRMCEVMILPEFWRKTIGIVPDFAHVLFVVGGSGTTYEIDLSTSDNPDQTVVIPYIPQSLQFQADQARKVPALDLMRSMMRGVRWMGTRQKTL